ncbi:MAG: putative membrane protein [Candidatus Woesebacteria bacterium GW2011_GWA1_33_30]|uniref:Putative membrane protein n=1 Tax=Candidatus Woesebacteria bacterium GW2011_GWA2_33_28 TaxID=1618561 RepID=A0A0F9ZT67_9BACT|nr:MAG: putative membrane protein [Candidatus Woesebacteria bacterium GW2011_GWA2_33_28]KKP48391.1 MAG: putative membrane protein [Candidatus Woesebacteria bacterium GW2011_GWA1_33_30]KKP49498.1 MAG: putative membrane protein [Microgenomates group bacterium GW2011_GWC1_33_32]KKP52463.1 MAG: putative membrane protein [Candidatus Woesebacteria bacterium GW2011_GWB1_33_38]KKP57191.1 MAG: putative membrane protein [Microgenomates group bacterium GW2011_GWD1_33_9]
MDFSNIKNWFSKNKDKIIKYFFIIISVLISVVIVLFRNELAKLTEFGYLGIFLINLVGSATIIIPTPSLIATFVGGSIYNPLLVGIFSGVGASIGELTGYLAGYGGSVAIKENKHYKKIEKWMNMNGFVTILVLATVPNPIFDLSGIFAGVTHYSLKKFFTAVLIGKTVRFIGLAFLGSNFL